MIARPTRGAAVDAADAMVERLGAAPQQAQRDFARRSATPSRSGAPYDLASAAESRVARPLLCGARGCPVSRVPLPSRSSDRQMTCGDSDDRLRAGRHHSQFLFTPDIDQMTFFSEAILPLVRARERRRAASPAPEALHVSTPHRAVRNQDPRSCCASTGGCHRAGERANASRAYQSSSPTPVCPTLTYKCRSPGRPNNAASILRSSTSPVEAGSCPAGGDARDGDDEDAHHRAQVRLCPTSFVQQMGTLSSLIGGRYSLNIVAGHSPAEQRGYGDTRCTHNEALRADGGVPQRVSTPSGKTAVICQLPREVLRDRARPGEHAVHDRPTERVP